MVVVMFPKDISQAIVEIAYQLEKANELRAEELEIRKKELELKGYVL